MNRNIYCYCLIIFLLGCKAENGQELLKDKFYGLMDKYFAANDLNTAKSYLLETTLLLDKNKKPCKQFFFQAANLEVTYLRLFVIAEKQGNQQEAKIYLEKARYWYIINRECTNEPIDKTLKTLDSFTPENARKLVEGLDKERIEFLHKSHVGVGEPRVPKVNND